MGDCICIGIGITWLLCALAAGYIYSEKGRSYAAAFLLGILLGPLALILAAITPKDEKALERRALRSGKMRKCPYCAELIRREAKVCRYCAHDVTMDMADVTIDMPDVTIGMPDVTIGMPELTIGMPEKVISTSNGMLQHKCRSCQRMYDLANMKFCPQCGWRDPNRESIIEAYRKQASDGSA